MLALLTMLVGACGSEHPTVSDDLEPTTVVDTTSTTAPASTSTPQPSTTTAAPTSTVAAPVVTRSDIVLHGDGLGFVDFGAPGDEVVAVLTEILGAPGLDAGPPIRMTTPIRNGCANRSDMAMMFEGLVVGFDDTDAGLVLSAWSAFSTVAPTSPPDPTQLATAEMLRLGASVAEAESVYGADFEPTSPVGWEWSLLRPSAVVDGAGGPIVIVENDTAHIEMMTAGRACQRDPAGVREVGPSPIGLTYNVVGRYDDPATPDEDPDRLILDHQSRYETEWASLGGACLDECDIAIQTVGPADGAPVVLWAVRRIGESTQGTVWEVTDSYVIQPGTSVHGTWDCGQVGQPVVDAAGEIIDLLDIDSETGTFVHRSDVDSCVTVGDEP